MMDKVNSSGVPNKSVESAEGDPEAGSPSIAGRNDPEGSGDSPEHADLNAGVGDSEAMFNQLMEALRVERVRADKENLALAAEKESLEGKVPDGASASTNSGTVIPFGKDGDGNLLPLSDLVPVTSGARPKQLAVGINEPIAHPKVSGGWSSGSSGCRDMSSVYESCAPQASRGRGQGGAARGGGRGNPTRGGRGKHSGAGSQTGNSSGRGKKPSSGPNRTDRGGRGGARGKGRSKGKELEVKQTGSPFKGGFPPLPGKGNTGVYSGSLGNALAQTARFAQAAKPNTGEPSIRPCSSVTEYLAVQELREQGAQVENTEDKGVKYLIDWVRRCGGFGLDEKDFSPIPIPAPPVLEGVHYSGYEGVDSLWDTSEKTAVTWIELVRSHDFHRFIWRLRTVLGHEGLDMVVRALALTRAHYQMKGSVKDLEIQTLRSYIYSSAFECDYCCSIEALMNAADAPVGSDPQDGCVIYAPRGSGWSNAIQWWFRRPVLDVSWLGKEVLTQTISWFLVNGVSVLTDRLHHAVETTHPVLFIHFATSVNATSEADAKYLTDLAKRCKGYCEIGGNWHLAKALNALWIFNGEKKVEDYVRDQATAARNMRRSAPNGGKSILLPYGKEIKPIAESRFEEHLNDSHRGLPLARFAQCSPVCLEIGRGPTQNRVQVEFQPSTGTNVWNDELENLCAVAAQEILTQQGCTDPDKLATRTTFVHQLLRETSICGIIPIHLVEDLPDGTEPTPLSAEDKQKSRRQLGRLPIEHTQPRKRPRRKRGVPMALGEFNKVVAREHYDRVLASVRYDKKLSELDKRVSDAANRVLYKGAVEIEPLEWGNKSRPYTRRLFEAECAAADKGGVKSVNQTPSAQTPLPPPEDSIGLGPGAMLQKEHCQEPHEQDPVTQILEQDAEAPGKKGLPGSKIRNKFYKRVEITARRLVLEENELVSFLTMARVENRFHISVLVRVLRFWGLEVKEARDKSKSLLLLAKNIKGNLEGVPAALVASVLTLVTRERLVTALFESTFLDDGCGDLGRGIEILSSLRGPEGESLLTWEKNQERTHLRLWEASRSFFHAMACLTRALATPRSCHFCNLGITADVFKGSLLKCVLDRYEQLAIRSADFRGASAAYAWKEHYNAGRTCSGPIRRTQDL